MTIFLKNSFFNFRNIAHQCWVAWNVSQYICMFKSRLSYCQTSTDLSIGVTLRIFCSLCFWTNYHITSRSSHPMHTFTVLCSSSFVSVTFRCEYIYIYLASCFALLTLADCNIFFSWHLLTQKDDFIMTHEKQEENECENRTLDILRVKYLYCCIFTTKTLSRGMNIIFK